MILRTVKNCLIYKFIVTILLADSFTNSHISKVQIFTINPLTSMCKHYSKEYL